MEPVKQTFIDSMKMTPIISLQQALYVQICITVSFRANPRNKKKHDLGGNESPEGKEHAVCIVLIGLYK